MEEKEKLTGNILAMYDVRGIQKYIYNTSKLKDAMGASLLVENIIMEALKYACKMESIEDYILEWDDDTNVFDYDVEEHNVNVLYIGGGNAYVVFRNIDLCKNIYEWMARYIIEKTYSLQLAAAFVPVTSSYKKDYEKIFERMSSIKSDMTDTRPLGALPVMKIEQRTGLPVIDMDKEKIRVDKYRGSISKETYLKILKKNKMGETDETYEIDKKGNKSENTGEDDIDKILDNYARRGKDSRIAVVHIDGNNMGLRIRKLIEDCDDYVSAVNKMRKISHNIKYSYLNTFNKMKYKFENTNLSDSINCKKDGLEDNPAKRFVRKVIVAGDDITYVCNAYIALDTVRYFCNEISKLTMNGGNSENDINEYGFSVCAGIAYINSHFPFSIAYEVAESCCDSAKKAAKNEKNKAYYKDYKAVELEEYFKGGNNCFEKTGNFVDFQICKNIQCKDLNYIRRKEFITHEGEQLMLRPYYIPMPSESDRLNEINASNVNNFDNLKQNIIYFTNAENIPHSFAKDIRNTYFMGSRKVNLLGRFLDSRGWKMPDENRCEDNMYVDIKGVRTAKWYDALEIADYCLENLLEDKLPKDNFVGDKEGIESGHKEN